MNETRPVLEKWEAGKLSTREAAERLSMSYYDFIEFASRQGFSVVPADDEASSEKPPD